MAGDAGEDVGEPSLRVDVVHFGRDDQAVHGGGAISAAIGAGKEPRFSSECDTAQKIPVAPKVLYGDRAADFPSPAMCVGTRANERGVRGARTDAVASRCLSTRRCALVNVKGRHLSRTNRRRPGIGMGQGIGGQTRTG